MWYQKCKACEQSRLTLEKRIVTVNGELRFARKADHRGEKGVAAMLRYVSYVAVLTAVIGGSAYAQRVPGTTPTENDMYCSGVMTTQSVPADTYVISGEESDTHITYQQG